MTKWSQLTVSLPVCSSHTFNHVVTDTPVIYSGNENTPHCLPNKNADWQRSSVHDDRFNVHVSLSFFIFCWGRTKLQPELSFNQPEWKHLCRCAGLLKSQHLAKMLISSCKSSQVDWEQKCKPQKTPSKRLFLDLAVRRPLYPFKFALQRSSRLYQFESLAHSFLVWVVVWAEFTLSDMKIHVTPHNVRRPLFWSDLVQRLLGLLRHTNSCVLWALLLWPRWPSSSPRWQLMVEGGVHNRAPLFLLHVPLSLPVLSYFAINMFIIARQCQLIGLFGLWFPPSRSPRRWGRGASSWRGLWGGWLHHGDFDVLQKINISVSISH